MTVDKETFHELTEAARIGMLPAWWAKRQPDVVAVASPTGDRTFAELNANINRLVRALRRHGLGVGDPVALLCTNRPEFVETLGACLRAGFRLTPINWHLTAAEVAYVLKDCGAKALVADDRVGDVARDAARESDDLTLRLAVGGPIDGFESYADLIRDEPGDDIDDPVLGGTMFYTSGTTGRPKGVHRPPAPPLLTNLGGYGDGTVDRNLVTGPLYHAAPLAFSLAVPMAWGCGVVLMEGWDAEETLRLIEAHRITHTHMVPTMFHRLLSLPEEVRSRYDLSSLRYVIHGAAPCPVEVKRRLIEWLGPIVWEYYAATEGTGSFVDAETWLAHPGTVGRPFTEGQVLIGDPDGNPLPAGETGLVFLRSSDATRFEYFNDTDKTADAYRGTYFTLGDVGRMDDEGYLYLTDRSANLIISGGVNIYSAEVDAVLLEHSAVGDAATIGVPNAEWGEEVKAVVELQPGLEPSDALADELLAFCRDRLAHFKCPRTVDFVDELPRQDNGKLYKRLLRDRYRDQATA